MTSSPIHEQMILLEQNDVEIYQQPHLTRGQSVVLFPTQLLIYKTFRQLEITGGLDLVNLNLDVKDSLSLQLSIVTLKFPDPSITETWRQALILAIEARRPIAAHVRSSCCRFSWKFQVRQFRLQKGVLEYEILCQVGFFKAYREGRCFWSVWKTHSAIHEFNRGLKKTLGWQMKPIDFPKDQAKQEKKGKAKSEEFALNRIDQLQLYFTQLIAFDPQPNGAFQMFFNFSTHFDPTARASKVCTLKSLPKIETTSRVKYCSPRHKRQLQKQMHYARLSPHAT